MAPKSKAKAPASGKNAPVEAPEGTAPRLTRKGEETRERIVSAAAGLIFERGVAGTSIEDVKDAAGVSSSQLYHYFVDKQALVHAVIAHQSNAVIVAQEPLLGMLDSIDALRAWRDQAVAIEIQLQCKGGCPIGTLAGELAEADPDARADIAAGFARWEEQIALGIAAMHDRGELPADVDPDRLALALLAAHQGGLILTQVRRDPAPIEAALDAMIDHVAELRAQSSEAGRVESIGARSSRAIPADSSAAAKDAKPSG